MQAAQMLNRRPFVARSAAWLLAGLCAVALLPAHAQFPTVTTRTETWSGNGQPPERQAERAQWEQWQLQRDQQQMQRELWRQQREQTRQDDQRIRQENESPGQRALREQAQNRREQGRMSSGDRR